jgi:hypothetical protein
VTPHALTSPQLSGLLTLLLARVDVTKALFLLH